MAKTFPAIGGIAPWTAVFVGSNRTSIPSRQRWLMRVDPGETMICNNDKSLEHSKRFQLGDSEKIRNSQSFYVPYVSN